MKLAKVWFIPEEVGKMVTIHAHWGADNGYETSTFLTKDEAIDFCWRRWKIPVDKIAFK